MKMTKEEAENLCKDIGEHLTQISRYFPEQFKFSLVGRDPSDPDGGVIVTSDDYFALAEMVHRVALGKDKTKVN